MLEPEADRRIEQALQARNIRPAMIRFKIIEIPENPRRSNRGLASTDSNGVIPALRAPAAASSMAECDDK